MSFFADSMVDYPASGSEMGLIVRPIGGGQGGAVKVQIEGGGISIGSASFASATVVRDSSDTAWVNVGTGPEGPSTLHMPVKILGTGANAVEPLNVTPIGSEYSLPVRQVGVVSVTGSVLALLSGNLGTQTNPFFVVQSGSQTLMTVTPDAGTVWNVTGSVSTIISTDGINPVGTITNPLVVAENGSIVDNGNSYALNLGANQVFTGTTTEVLHYSQILVSVKTDKDGTLRVDFGQDGVNWDYSYQDSITGGEAHFDPLPPKGRYYRVVYTNGNQAQTYLRLQTILRPISQAGRFIEISEHPKELDIASLTKSVITGRSSTGGGAWIDVKVDPAGKLLSVVNPEAGAVWQVTGSMIVASIPAITGSVSVINQPTHLDVTVDNASLDVNVLTLPQLTASISNTVSVAGNVTVTNPVTQLTASIANTVAVIGSVSVANPVTQLTASISNPVNVYGNVSVASIPAITGHVSASIENTVQVTGSMYITNQPAPLTHVTASIENTVSVLGSVAVTNPVTQLTASISNPVNVYGTVSVASIPAVTGHVTASIDNIVDVTGSVYILNQPPVTGHVTASIDNVVDVTGSVWVINQQDVTGHVTASIDNTVSVTGSVWVINQQAVTGHVTASIDNTVTVRNVSVGASGSEIAATGSAIELLASNNRVGFSIYNHSTNILYLKFGAGLSYTSFSVALGSNAFYESQNAYSGPVYGLWDTPVTGSAQITEYN